MLSPAASDAIAHAGGLLVSAVRILRRKPSGWFPRTTAMELINDAVAAKILRKLYVPSLELTKGQPATLGADGL